jgi:nitrite reductase/ring-hydroxylating ferredoxin subunit
MSETEIYAICDAVSVGKGGVVPFTLARRGENGVEEAFPILIGRDDSGQVFAYVNVCPHGQETLYAAAEPLDAASRALVCTQHGAVFDTGSGVCTSGPCKGQRLRSVPVAEHAGEIYIGGITLIEEGEDGPPEVMITSD